MIQDEEKGPPPPHSPEPSESPPEGPSEPRELTIDDVERLGNGAGVAIGCAVIVAAAIVLFWLVRGWLLH
jgi:hypothetical protein